MVIIPGKNKNLSARYFSNIIDYLIFFVLIGAYIYSVGTQTENGAYRVTGFKALLIPLIWILYFPLCESINGQTLGKIAFRLYVVDLNGGTPLIAQTFMRRIVDMFDIVFFGIPSLLSINHSDKNQRIGDRIAGTTVIKTEAVCKFCGIDVALTSKEVINDRFTCPTCNEVN